MLALVHLGPLDCIAVVVVVQSPLVGRPSGSHLVALGLVAGAAVLGGGPSLAGAVGSDVLMDHELLVGWSLPLIFSFRKQTDCLTFRMTVAVVLVVVVAAVDWATVTVDHVVLAWDLVRIPVLHPSVDQT